MSGDMCSACGQPLPSREREGVYLPPRKAKIYDAIRTHPGISVEGIQAKCLPFRMSVKTIHVHINQINDMMAGTDVKIRGRIDGYRIYIMTPAAQLRDQLRRLPGANRLRKPAAQSS
jgi:hypothetical protein